MYFFFFIFFNGMLNSSSQESDIEGNTRLAKDLVTGLIF